jgi:uncharacterized membrane protein
MSEQDEFGALRESIAQLTRRVYHLEQRVGSSAEVSQQEKPAGATPAAPRIPIAPSAAMAAAELPAALRSKSHGEIKPGQAGQAQAESLERRIGSQWLNRVGVVAVLIGVSYFLKLAFDNGWIGPGFRVLIGCLVGVGLCGWSERFRGPNSLAFSHSLKAVGVGVLYLSLWASFQLYHLLPATIAFVAMMLVTAATAGMAITQDAELLAGLALLGGLLTPVLCDTHQNHEAALFGYLLLLSLGALALQRVKPWPRILLGAFVGSCLLSASWFDSYYTDDQFAATLLFMSLLFALFAAAPLCAMRSPEHDRLADARPQVLLATLNAAGYFYAITVLMQISGGPAQAREGAYALGLAAVYAGLGVALDRRAGDGVGAHSGVRSNAERLPPMTHYGLAITFLTVGIALRLHQHWITLAWLVEGALVFWAGARAEHRGVKRFAAVVAALGLLRLLTVDLYSWGEQPPVLNARLATFAVAIAALLWMIYLDAQSPDREADSRFLAAGMVAVNLLALLAAGLEIHDTFEPLLRAAVWGRGFPNFGEVQRARRSLVILRSFSYSALLMLYGAGLMWLGFARRSSLLRWQAILLIAVTILKVFFFDISDLDHLWRVLSFIVLGALLLAISYAYQRDWLGLQRPRTG